MIPCVGLIARRSLYVYDIITEPILLGLPDHCELIKPASILKQTPQHSGRILFFARARVNVKAHKRF